MAVEAEKVWIQCAQCGGSGKVSCPDCDGEGGRMGIPEAPRQVLHRWLIARVDGSTEYGRGDQTVPALQAGERLWFTYRDEPGGRQNA
jgi:hypothetical protein